MPRKQGRSSRFFQRHATPVVVKAPQPFSRNRELAARWRHRKRFANTFNGHSVKDLLKETGHDHADGFLPSESAALRVEDQFFVNTPAGGAVGATNIVGFDFQSGNRIGTGFARKQQIVVALITIGLLGLFVDLDHASPHGAGAVLQSRFVKEVTGAIGLLVVLQRVISSGAVCFR